ncbi:two-component regulator propeller domain-containing protein [Formosa maritima]|uniref:histidine kinase n=1 Tax=Formosa maritima TaxID=2592046 RepID=A0A5D0GI65_9FLAO|nr:two-component regulator propeller domain-containing protein [Formosa maritima]TYA57517.1 hypothetical protein FVF61_04625 [Formosa maritima]
MKNKGDFLRRTLNMLLVCIFITSSVVAQTEKIAFEKYGVAEGLPEEVGINFIQDQQGYIWIGTQNGLAKFNGYKMEVTRANLDNPDGLHLRNLSGGILLANDGKLWLGGVSNSGGLATYDPKTEKFTNYPIVVEDSTKIPYRNCTLLFEDIAKNIWFSSRLNSQEGFLCKMDPETQIVTRYSYNVGRKYNDIVLNFEIAESKKDSSVWLRAQDYNILRYDRAKDVFEIQFKTGDIIPGTTLTDSIVDINTASKSGLILMTNNKHLFLWDPILRKVVDTYTFTNRDDIVWGANFEDTHGNFWVSSHDNLTRINRDSKQREDFKFGKGALDFKVTGKVLEIIPQSHNDAFIFFEVNSTDTNNGSFNYTLRYEFESKSFEFFDYQFNDENNPFENNGFRRKFALDHSGLLWVGTRPNIYKQSPKSRQITLLNHDPKDKSSLPSDDITALFEDSKQQLWVGTDNGIALKNSDKSFNTFGWFSGNKTGTTIGRVYAIIEDSNGVIWIGSSDGLYRWSASKKMFEKLLTNLGDKVNVRTLSKDSKDHIWVSVFNNGTYVLDEISGNVISKFEPKNNSDHGLTSTTITKIFLDSKQQIWLGDPRGNGVGLFRYLENENKFAHYNYNPNDSTSIKNNEIRILAEDDRHRLWIGTDAGINLYNPEKDNFFQNKDEVNLPSISYSVKATNGKLWVLAYSGGGLALIGPRINDVTMYGEDKGLLHNDANSFAFDDHGKLWIPTERGLSVFDTLTKKYTSYFEKDGFQKYGRYNLTLKTQNGDIWIGGLNGLNLIVPDKLSKKDLTKPAVYITAMGIMDSLYTKPDGDIFKKAVSFTNQVKLKYWQKNLSFEFIGLHYLRPEDNLYSWKLENYNEKWSTPSKARTTAYTNLSPGIYTFRVKASNADGTWNEEGASIEIVITPPWWLTWWAYIIYGLIVLLIGFRIHKYQKEHTLRLAREESQKKELEQAKEIEKAYLKLKSTQAQLIQSEKMASLGELTAGIAHEIQNPLNFVNNFSEVNIELIDEMQEELKVGNPEEAIEISKDIKENQLKINHHGRRADAIVKGMLKHSRNTSGEKEPTNINAIADEYLRLAYHGLRAKDKSFNATLNTDFDESIGLINVAGQDMGRVILNLITNALHAISPNSKATKEETIKSPTIWISTKQLNDKVFIEVKDNGSGIPKRILDKIFQPFFTTKPSGQGTGLGLSMSYDIVKSHGGELKVKSKEGEGTTFTIIIPK